ncbi:MAG: holo-ACP synthase [Gemmataceae bacterium]
MELVGLGTQIIECARVRKLIEAHAETFLATVYTEQEMLFCRDRSHSTEYYTAVWAAKEATFRSLGTKWRRGSSWKDVELFCGRSIAPTVTITGATERLQRSLGVKVIRVSFAYTRQYATATAIALSS